MATDDKRAAYDAGRYIPEFGHRRLGPLTSDAGSAYMAHKRPRRPSTPWPKANAFLSQQPAVPNSMSFRWEPFGPVLVGSD
ncbi:hypothetical protein [Arthrobacter sp. A5]|uniref:hypothetical protein n=1 Tax=Arthrobacter sp. A5 TaxID=576926 RepID=UPI003DA99B6D